MGHRCGQMPRQCLTRELCHTLHRVAHFSHPRHPRTLSHETAGVSPLDLLARMYSAMYHRRVTLLGKLEGSRLDVAIEKSRRQARRQLFQVWKHRLDKPHVAQQVVEAVRLFVKDWLNGSTSRLTYCVTQVTGHG